MVEPFDVHVVISNFSRALLDEDDVLIVEYIDAYSELNKCVLRTISLPPVRIRTVFSEP